MKLMTVKTLKEMTGLSKSKLYELIESGALPHYRIGGSIRVSEEQWLEYLEQCRRGEEEPVKLRHLR